jgi:L-ascorbate metabolism protein UlaG (beta-lactamase superfamily)
MVITYYGISCFKIQSGETVLVFDPPSKDFPVSDFGLKIPRFQTDIVLISHNQHKDHNGYETLPGKGDSEYPFIIDGPGDYEIQKVLIKGIKSFHDSELGKKFGLNTIYVVEIEGINICHMGDFGEKNLTGQIKESLRDIDILFIPILGPSMDPQMAAQIAAQIEAKIIIPMHYHKDKKALKKFLDEFGNGENKPVEKLTLKKKDIADKKGEAIILIPCL